MPHPLHFVVGSFLSSIVLSKNERLLLAPECGGSNNLPLFMSSQKRNDTEICNVDALIIQNDNVRIIIEIEESGLIPTKICGKFLTSALSTHLIHDILSDQAMCLAEKVCFIQIIDSSRFPQNSSKLKQGNNLELSIQNILPINNISEYSLLYFSGAKGFSENQLQSILEHGLTKPCT